MISSNEPWRSACCSISTINVGRWDSQQIRGSLEHGELVALHVYLDKPDVPKSRSHPVGSLRRIVVSNLNRLGSAAQERHVRLTSLLRAEPKGWIALFDCSVRRGE